MQEIRNAAKRRQKQTKKDMTTKLWTKKSKKGMER
jgi:hypothetical protein